MICHRMEHYNEYIEMCKEVKHGHVKKVFTICNQCEEDMFKQARETTVEQIIDFLNTFYRRHEDG